MTIKRNLWRRTIPFLALGLLAFILYLFFFVNLSDMMTMIKQTNLAIYSLTLGVAIVEVYFFALAWQYYLAPLSARISFRKIFAYTWVSNFVDLLVPAESVSGEITRIYFLTRDGIDAGKAVASILIQRIFGTIFIASALLIGALNLWIWHVPFPSLIQSLMLLVIFTTAIFLSIIIALCLKESWTQKLVDKTISFIERVTRKRWNLDSWRNEAKKGVKAFYESIRAFATKPKRLLLPVSFSIISWVLGIFIYYLVFSAIGYTLDWTILIIVYSLVVTIKSIPIGVPAEVGVTEIAMTTLFGAFLGPGWLPIGAAATILIRIVTVWFRFVIGFCAFQWIGVKSLLENGSFIKVK